MIWKPEPLPVAGERKWRRYLCLRPRRVGGYKIWLEYVERECIANYYYKWIPQDNFRLTEKQKVRIGERW